MNRSLKYKLLYLAILVIGGGGMLAILFALEVGTMGLLVAALLLLVPGRVGGYLQRDLFLSVRHLSAQRYDEAISAAERFLDALDRQPWRQYNVYGFFGFYTWNARAMALNNMGAAEMELGWLEAAEARLGEALSLDGAYPIPYYNLSIIAAVRGDHKRSALMMAKAEQLGYTGSAADQAIMRVAAAYARVQSFPE